MRKVLIICALALLTLPLQAQKYTLSGRVMERGSETPVEFATVVIGATEQWSVTDAQGRFTIKDIPATKSKVTISLLGYVTVTKEFTFNRNITDCKFLLEEDNLSLEGAMVTAKENDAAATTSRTIDKTALEHVQLMNVSDISALLPGGVTTDNNLITAKQFNIRAGSSSEAGNASFGTAVEVDGVRLSSNASYETTSGGDPSMKGVNTNSIASANIESVEVISGVPSVEYGDMGSGVVKINTKKGKTPWMINLSTSPRTKQAAFSKGFDLGKNKGGKARGILNASAEYTRSVGDVMSPYKSYDRKQLSLLWSNTFAGGMPLRLSLGLTGNLGGLDDKADPDKMLGTFSKARDNSVRANIQANWLLSLPWITNLELNASFSYGDKAQRERTKYIKGATDPALHTTQEGYFITAPYAEGAENSAVGIPPGERFNVMGLDDRPLNAKVTLKANWATHWGKVGNKIKLGADWNWDHNLGIGQWTEELATAPTFRPYRYCDNPSMHNLGLYAEDNLLVPVGRGRINFIAGLRADNTFIRGSAYGSTSSLSPRFNLKYTVIDPMGRSRMFLRELAFRASWGVAVKLPSFNLLYPTPTYQDVEVFRSSADSQNNVTYGFYVHPRTIEYNAGLRWQRNRQAECGVDVNLGGTRISLAGFYTRTFDSYRLDTDYTLHPYNNTGTLTKEGSPIPAENRIYTMDGNGLITVHDKTETFPSQVLPSEVIGKLLGKQTAVNRSHPVTRYGVEWVVDFTKIEALGTTIRLDGSYYTYTALDSDMQAYTYSQVGTDGKPYRYVGYYYGGHNTANGSETRTLRNNITITTHIPKVRLIVSLKLESTLLSYSRYLSQRADGSALNYVLTNEADYLSYDKDASIYEGNHYTVLFPDYYVDGANPTQQFPFLEKYIWAKENDINLYNDLGRLVQKSNTAYIFAKDYVSPYFSANFSVTKELGDRASVSFYANNFFNNMGQVYSSREGKWESVSSRIPSFYYGLTVRLKF